MVTTYHSHLIGPLSMATLESFDQLLVIHNAHFIIDTKFINLELQKIEKKQNKLKHLMESELKSRMWEKNWFTHI